MRLGLMTEPQLGMTYDTQVQAARVAERIGVEVFARSDHYAFPGAVGPHATDAFAALAGLARDTETIGLCVLVSPITFRHPAVIAKSAATVDEMSGGRMIVGVGTGWMDHEHDLFGLELHEMAERAERQEEALGYLRAAFGRTPGGFDGQYYRLGDEPIIPAPTGSLPIVVGGNGERRTPRLAGTYADEYNPVFIPVSEVAPRVERCRAAASQAGRDPDDVLISMMGGAVVGTDTASYRRNLERVAAAHPFGRTPEQVEEGLRKQGLPVGPADEALEAVANLAAAGIERYYVQMLGPLDDDLIEETFAVLGG